MATTPEFKLLIKQTKKKAKKEQRANKRFFNRIKRKKPVGITGAFRNANDAVFKKIDCLDCANCCKTSLAVFENSDVKRISKHVGMAEKDFIKKYLKPHPDYDYLIKTLPCAFLGSDNKCSIYEIRPAGCRTYPPFKLRLSSEQLDVIYDNLGICPAANQIVDLVRVQFDSTATK